MGNNMRQLTCDGEKTCASPVTHIDEKGWIYCAHHGERRKAYKRCRKLRGWDLKLLREGKPLPSYEVRPRSFYEMPCVRDMKCLCAGHARGNPASAPCDTTE